MADMLKFQDFLSVGKQLFPAEMEELQKGNERILAERRQFLKDFDLPNHLRMVSSCLHLHIQITVWGEDHVQV